MNAFEKLLAEFENELTIVFDKNLPNKLPGLICDRTIYLNSSLPFDEAICVLSEEIGHYKTSTPKDITDYNQNAKEERRARNWGYKKLVPLDKLKQFIIQKECVMPYELAEEFGITEEFCEEAVRMYRVKGELD